jgi:hypothetical protein
MWPPKARRQTKGADVVSIWGGTLYGFSTNGNVYSFDPTTGEATGVVVNGAPLDTSYEGAAVTTAAPLVVPE